MSDPIELVKAAFHEDNPALLRGVLENHPELKTRVNEPVFAFDSLAINCARSRGMLDVLLDAGADINAKSRWWAGGFGILHSAEPQLAAYAIERGAVVDVHAAARLGMLERVRELVASNATLVHARGGDGQTPLHFASTVEIAEYLLDRGAEIDALDVDHESTPAQYMVRDRQAVAKYLVGKGCRTDVLMGAALGDLELVRRHLEAEPGCIRISVCDRDFPKRNPHSGGCIYIWTLGQNKSAHVIAREFGQEDVLRLLMEHSPAELKLSLACEMGDEDVARALLVDNPHLVRSLAEEDCRRVAYAAQGNNTAAVRLMLSAGWPVDARGQHNATALHWAGFHGNSEMAKEILRYSPALEDMENEYHSTPLGWAVYGSEHGWYRKTGDYAGTVELLCAAGARVSKELAGSEAVKGILRRHRGRDQAQ